MTKTGLVLGAVFVALATPLVISGSARLRDPRARDQRLSAAVPAGRLSWTGNRKAPVAVVVYSDYTCRACGMLLDVLEQPIRDGRVRVVWRHFTNEANVYSRPLARLGVCAASAGALMPYSKLAFRAPEEAAGLASLSRRPDSVAVPRWDVVQECLRSVSTDSAVSADHADALRLGVTKTPTIWIGGRRYDGLPDDLDAIISRYAWLERFGYAESTDPR